MHCQSSKTFPGLKFWFLCLKHSLAPYWIYWLFSILQTSRVKSRHKSTICSWTFLKFQWSLHTKKTSGFFNNPSLEKLLSLSSISSRKNKLEPIFGQHWYACVFVSKTERRQATVLRIREWGSTGSYNYKVSFPYEACQQRSRDLTFGHLIWFDEVRNPNILRFPNLQHQHYSVDFLFLPGR